MRGVGHPQNAFSAAPLRSIHQRKNRQSCRHAEKDTPMFKTFAAALLAASVFSAPVLAQGTSTKSTTPATEMTKAPESKAAVKTVKANKHVTKKHVVKNHVTKNHVTKKHVVHAKHRKPVKVVKADGRHHAKPVTKPVSAKPALVDKTTTGS